MKKSFVSKEDETLTIKLSADEVKEIVPDADMRYSLVILKDGQKHFVSGTEKEIREKLQ